MTAEFAPGSAPDDLVDDPGRAGAGGATARGEPVTDVRLVGPELTAGQPGLVAVPVRLPDAGMVDLLDVGDRIDLVAADPQEGARAVADDVPVLAIPAADDQATARDLPGGWSWSAPTAARSSRGGRRGAVVRDVHLVGPLGSKRLVHERHCLGTGGELMSGFKNFILRGNLIEIAVAFIIAASFAAVVTAFTELADQPPAQAELTTCSATDEPFGAFMNAVIAFVILAAVVYFFVVVPYTDGQGEVLPEPGAGDARGHQAAAGDPRPAVAAPGLSLQSPWCGGTCDLSQSSDVPGASPASRSSAVVSGSTSPKTSASRRRRSSSVSVDFLAFLLMRRAPGTRAPRRSGLSESPGDCRSARSSRTRWASRRRRRPR